MSTYSGLFIRASSGDVSCTVDGWRGPGGWVRDASVVRGETDPGRGWVDKRSGVETENSHSAHTKTLLRHNTHSIKCLAKVK